MKINEHDVGFLSAQTGFSKSKCRSVLENVGGDVDIALDVLKKLRTNKFEVAWDMLASFFMGESGRRIAIYDGDKELVSIPALLPVFFFVFIPSWLTAATIFIIFLFDMDFKSESKKNKNKKRSDGTIIVEEYKDNIKNMRKPKKSDADDSGDEFDEYTIE